MLGFSRFDFDGLDNEARVERLLAPWDDGLDRVPDIGPYCTIFPLELDHDELTDVHIQRDEKGIGFITSNFFIQSDGDFLVFLFCSKECHSKSWFSGFLKLVDELDLELVMIHFEGGLGACNEEEPFVLLALPLLADVVAHGVAATLLAAQAQALAEAAHVAALVGRALPAGVQQGVDEEMHGPLVGAFYGLSDGI